MVLVQCAWCTKLYRQQGNRLNVVSTLGKSLIVCNRCTRKGSADRWLQGKAKPHQK